MRTDLSIPADGAVLAATVSRPDGDRPPALVAVHGADRGARDWYLYEHLHRVLPPAGIAVVTFDRRGDGASTGEPSRGRFEQQAEDALAVIDHAAREADLDAEKIGLWGISQGGVGRAARGDDVGPRGLPGAPRLLRGHAGRADALDGEASRRRVRSARRPAPRPSGSGSTLSTGCEAATALRSRRPSPRAGRSRGGRRPGSRRRCRATRLATRCGPSSTSTQPAVFARVRVPTLLVYGDEDEWIPVDESLAAWREARGDEIDIVMVLGTGHEPAHGEDVSSEYEESLLTWLRATAGL